MKKKYISPALTVVLIEHSTFLAASDISGIDGAYGLGLGGYTDDEDIISGNTKSNDWEDIWD